MYSPLIAKFQSLTYFLFIVASIIGFLLNEIWAIRVGAYALFIVAILYNINIYKIILHKVKNVAND